MEEIKEAQQIYGEKKIVYFPYGEFKNEEADFITFWLLGECNEVITTEFSSYGLNAAARAGIVPAVCTHEKYCFKRLTPQPCAMHPWPVEPICRLEASSFHKLPDIEMHCGFENEYARNCVEHGCADNHDSWKKWGKIPAYPPPKCNISAT